MPETPNPEGPIVDPMEPKKIDDSEAHELFHLILDALFKYSRLSETAKINIAKKLHKPE